MMNQRYPLHALVRRALLRRLLLVTLAVSLLVGGATWFQVRHQAKDRVVRVALDRIALIRAEYFDLLDQGVPVEDAVPRAINSLGDLDLDMSGGSFIHGAFYHKDGDFHQFDDSPSPEVKAAQTIVGVGRSRRPESGDNLSAMVRVAGQPAVHVIVPIASREGQVRSWVTAVYLLSRAEAAKLVREPLVTVALIVMIVLVTSALFFPVVMNLARRLAGFSADLLEANLEMMEALGCAIAKRDGDTDAHNYRVTIYSVRLAEKEGLSNRAIQGLIKGAFLHDIGKIGIRDEVLLKPGKLTDEEYEIMKTHVDHGLDIVGRSGWLADALDIVGGHHEKYGGDGYPQQMPGDMIPTAARIFAIADVFDALSSSRPYKEAMPLSRVVDILEEGRARHFDPVLLDCFLAMAPDLHAELTPLTIEELQAEMKTINARYFASGLEALPA